MPAPRVEVTKDVRTVSRASGKGPRAEQTAYFHGGGAYPERISIALWKDDPEFTPGLYEVDPASFYVDKFGSLKLGSLKLIPVKG